MEETKVMRPYEFIYGFLPYLITAFSNGEAGKDLFYTKEYWEEIIQDSEPTFDWDEIEIKIVENDDEELIVAYTLPKETEEDSKKALYQIYTPFSLLVINRNTIQYYTLERSVSRDEAKTESWFVGLSQNGQSRVNFTSYVSEINVDSFIYFISRVTSYDNKLEKIILDYNQLGIYSANVDAKKQLEFLTDEELMKYVLERFNKKFIINDMKNSVLLLQVFQSDLQKNVLNSDEKYSNLISRIVDIVHMNLEATIKYCLENHSKNWFKLNKVTTKNFLHQLEIGLIVNNELLKSVRIDSLKNRIISDNNKINDLQQELIK